MALSIIDLPWLPWWSLHSALGQFQGGQGDQGDPFHLWILGVQIHGHLSFLWILLNPEKDITTLLGTFKTSNSKLFFLQKHFCLEITGLVVFLFKRCLIWIEIRVLLLMYWPVVLAFQCLPCGQAVPWVLLVLAHLAPQVSPAHLVHPLHPTSRENLRNHFYFFKMTNLI